MFPIKKSYIVIPRPPKFEYNIPLTDCDTYRKILSRVHDLSEKSWVSRELIEKFINTALHQHNLPRA